MSLMTTYWIAWLLNANGSSSYSFVENVQASAIKFNEFQKSNPGIKIHVLLEDEDRLVFSPSFNKMQRELLQLINDIATAIKSFDRLEKRMDVGIRWNSNKMVFLNPIISDEYIEQCRYTVYEMLEEQRIGPELRLQDFDEYMSLMNGTDAEYIYKFIETEPPFDKYCELIDHYNAIEEEISLNVWGVVSMGLFEFHRNALIDTLKTLARFLQSELLSKMVSDQQADMATLQNEYENISTKALSIPKNTSELMESKSYVKKTQDETIPDMEQRLKMVS